MFSSQRGGSRIVQQCLTSQGTFILPSIVYDDEVVDLRIAKQCLLRHNGGSCIAKQFFKYSRRIIVYLNNVNDVTLKDSHWSFQTKIMTLQREEVV
jgi:hypothetical protein